MSDDSRLPDPRDREGYDKLAEAVDQWIGGRDRRLIRHKLIQLHNLMVGEFVSATDREGTGTNWRRFDRYMEQARRLAASLAGSEHAAIVYIQREMPPFRKPLETLDAGLRYFSPEFAEQGTEQARVKERQFVERVVETFDAHVEFALEAMPDRLIFGLLKHDEYRGIPLRYIVMVAPTRGYRHPLLVRSVIRIGSEEIPPSDFFLITEGRLPVADDIFRISLGPEEAAAFNHWCTDVLSEQMSRSNPLPRLDEAFRGDGMARAVLTSDQREEQLYKPESPYLRSISLPFRGRAVGGFFDLLGFSYYLEKEWELRIAPEEILKQLRRDLMDAGQTSIGGACFPEVRTISDSIVAFSPLLTDRSDPISAFMTVAKLGFDLQYLAARLGFGLRGAIDLGDIYCDGEDVTGPLLARLVRLEHQANGMRTLVGPALLDEVTSRWEELNAVGRSAHQYKGQTVYLRVMPRARLLFGAMKLSSDGLWRIRYRPDISAWIHKLYASAPTPKTKQKYHEFLSTVPGGREAWVDEFPDVVSKVPDKEALVAASTRMWENLTSI